jgi:hypothetical protein
MSAEIHEAPLAMAIDGRLVVNVAAMVGEMAPAKFLVRALETMGRLFIGVTLTHAAAATHVLARLEESGHEAVAHVVAFRLRT